MSWMDQIGGLLQQYTNVNAHQAPAEAQDHFDQFAQAAPASALADGLAAAFRSDQTPPFGQMLGQLFGQSNNGQRAGILNTLIGAVGPTLVSQVLARQGAAGVAGLLSGGHTEITPDAAAQVSPEAVAELAAHAEQREPSVVDMVSNFYAEHPTLVKSLGAAALSIAMAKFANTQRS